MELEIEGKRKRVKVSREDVEANINAYIPAIMAEARRRFNDPGPGETAVTVPLEKKCFFGPKHAKDDAEFEVPKWAMEYVVAKLRQELAADAMKKDSVFKRRTEAFADPYDEDGPMVQFVELAPSTALRKGAKSRQLKKCMARLDKALEEQDR